MSDHMNDYERAIVERFGAFPLYGRLMGLGYVGSVSHGTHDPDPDSVDDVDLMGIVVPPARYVIGMGTWTHWDYGPDADGLDVILYSVRRITSLMMKSNPNVLGFLWLRPEHYLVRTPWLNLMIENRDAFLSKRAHGAFAGYANGQLQRLERGVKRGYMGEKREALVRRFGYDPKNAAHLIRLLRMCVEFLDTGELNVYREQDGAELRAIKDGAWSLERVKREADALFTESRAALERSALPEEPDYDRAETILMKIHAESLSKLLDPT